MKTLFGVAGAWCGNETKSFYSIKLILKLNEVVLYPVVQAGRAGGGSAPNTTSDRAQASTTRKREQIS